MRQIMTDRNEFTAIVQGCHNNPFAVLGPHRRGSDRIVRTFQPDARQVSLVNANGDIIAAMQEIHAGGLFEGRLPPRQRRYALRVVMQDGRTFDTEDPYRFPSTLGEMDLYLLGEGSDQHIYKKLGSHIMKVMGVSGTRFAVWAPNASRVSVVGDFNQWDGRRHVMRLHPGNGIWEIFVPGTGAGAKYKYEIQDADGKLLPLKTDPYAAYYEPPPGNSSIVFESRYGWRDSDWMSERSSLPVMNQAISIYEVHPGSWRRKDDGSSLSYRELANDLVDYVQEMGFTHIELLPVTEHPFDGSWVISRSVCSRQHSVLANLTISGTSLTAATKPGSRSS
jgi:1,4-alpha-glucan branching enzyme